MNRLALAQKPTPALALSVVLLAALTACGGGSATDPAAQSAAASDSSTAASQASTDGALDSAVATAMAQTEVLPSYHMAPALLDEPGQVDVGGTSASARLSPKSFDVDASIANMDTRRLSRQALAERLTETAKARVASASGESTTPLSTTITGQVYTPAQMRAAYGLPALPVAGASLTTAQAAALGRGQTIYLVDAYHDATALSDLNAFSAKFGLPTCTNVAIPTTTTKLAAAPANCTFSAVYSSTRGTMTATAPVYNATWAPESKLDVQWAHAIAPLARIVLIEMPNAMSNSILDGNTLATKLGPGVVSMSFGSTEAGWAPTVDAYFVGTGMTFVAAAGDSGAQVLWPAVSPNVLAVGGTATNWSGSGSRVEVAWASSGGGMSAYEARPTWQSGVTPTGGSALVRRAVPDVAFNASPMTGEYVAVTLPGAATVWSAYGGTSIAAPQWAGVVAVANALRVANSKAMLGDFHTLLYKSIAAVPGTYAAALGDVVQGGNGTCATCKAGVGFDLITGWGSPNTSQLFAALTGVSTPLAEPTAAPLVPGGSYAAKAGSALSQSLDITAPSGTTTTYALSGAPSGLAVDSTGTLKWAAPVAGSYAFTAKATTTTGITASGAYALKVIPGTAPVFASSGHYSGSAVSVFSGALSATNPNTATLSYSVSGAPSGLTASTGGALSWAAPVAGSYTFTAKVTDSYGYSATQTEVLTVAGSSANHAPTIASSILSEKAGAFFASRLNGKDTDGDALTYTMSGAPAGVSLAGGILSGRAAVRGTYAVTITVHDSHGATGSAVLKLVVA